MHHLNHCHHHGTPQHPQQPTAHAAHGTRTRPHAANAPLPSSRCMHAAAPVAAGRSSNSNTNNRSKQQLAWDSSSNDAAAGAAAIRELAGTTAAATTWQQRQQRQQQPKQKTRKQQSPSPPAPAAQPPAAGTSSSSSSSLARQFAACQSFAALHRCLQQQQPLPAPAPADANAAAPATMLPDSQQQQEQPPPPPPPPPLLSSMQDCVALIDQLGLLARQQQQQAHHLSVSGANQFVEDQALQQLLAVVYAQLDLQLASQQQQQQPGSGSLSPRQLLHCVSTLAGLKYTQPVQLGAALHAAAVKPDARAGRQQQQQQQAATLAGPAPGAAAAAAAAATGGGSSISGYRQALGSLGISQLSGLVASLARSGVRPSNTWLLAFMQVAQQKLPTAGLPHLAQLLSGLVKVGVKPTTAWLDSMEARAIQCLLEHAVRQQVSSDQQQQQQASAAASSSTSSAQSWQPLRQQQAQSGSSRGRGRGGRGGRASSGRGSRSPNSSRVSSWQLQHVAQLLSALSEAKHTPRPQLAAVLWGATAGSLAAADAATLVELVAALGELQLVPPAAWLQQFFAASSASTVMAAYRPWQLSSSVAAVGRLAAAADAVGGSGLQQPQPQQQQQRIADLQGCAAWADALLVAVQQQLSSFAARDLAALLSGFAALRLQLSTAQVQQLLPELQGKLPRLNTAGLADVSEALVALSQQQQQQSEAAAVFKEALLREVAVKLPVFPAEDLARVLLAVAATPAEPRPSHLWLQAAAAQLSSKLTLLAPATLVSVLHAFADLGCPPEQQWMLQAAAAIDVAAAGGLAELTAPQLQQLLALLVSQRAVPPAAWLDRAAWAAQQSAVAVGSTEVPQLQLSSCTDLLAQLRDMQQQQQAAGGTTPPAKAAASAASATAH